MWLGSSGTDALLGSEYSLAADESAESAATLGWRALRKKRLPEIGQDRDEHA